MATYPVAVEKENKTAVDLAFGFDFSDLYRTERLVQLDTRFIDWLSETQLPLAERLLAGRGAPNSFDRKSESELLLALAPHLEDFVAQLFGVQAEVLALAARHHELAPLYSCKRLFVQRRAMKKIKPDEAAVVDAPKVAAQLAEEFGEPFNELAFARHVTEWLKDEAAHEQRLELALHYAAWAALTPAGKARHRDGVLFKAPGKLDPLHLLPLAEESLADGVKAYRLHHLRRREGFALTDAGTDLVGALDEANYCIWCHEQGRDSCSSGLKEKTGAFKKSPFGVTLAGCPLEERISEFHKLKTEGLPVAALAMIMVENPLCAATGHRICNDCMKSCIYQKQDPVNIPQAETRTLKDVLALPWGFEIYSLLTRWNPLHLRRPYPRPASGRRALVVGMGPAGFTLAHHLMNDGHSVVGIDGLKVEPLRPEIAGVDASGARVPFQPIRDVNDLYERLDERSMAGFGGVAEYGITVRWDKNFLKIIRLLLERREQFALIGGVRFGGTVPLEEAFALGFDHVALAMGAGRPTVLGLPNGLARGVRTASDFLMALQLTGAAKTDSIANMQLRLPVVVIGGGLTAIDTATESLAYYAVQVEKFLRRYEILVAEQGESAVRNGWSTEEQTVAEEFIAHGKALRAERAAAKADGRPARVVELLQSWGGVTIAYRKRLIDSPAYTLNHEEIEKALEEGVRFAECLAPAAVEVDGGGHAAAVRFNVQQRSETGEWTASHEITLPARAVLVAAGTQPNTVLAREDSEHFKLDGRYFAACDESGAPVKPERAISKPTTVNVLQARTADGRLVSFFGDLHPSYFGNVVKAMGSATQGYPIVSRVMGQRPPASTLDDDAFLSHIRSQLYATVHQVVRLTPTIVEVIVQAPLAARRFQPGQFYRLQNFEAHSLNLGDSRLAMEGLALTGAWVDRDRGLISTIVLEMGGSSSLCAYLQPGERVVLMGPTGAPTEIHGGETVVLVGGGLGNAVLFSIGAAFRAAGSKVLYFAGYKKVIDRYKVPEIEAAADAIVWCCDEAPGFKPTRTQDKNFVGNIVQAIAAYGRGDLGTPPIALSNADRMIAIGSDRMMAAVAAARHRELKPYLKAGHFAIGSINSPMQCMMKEICGQCLQPHRDPVTGKETYVFSCFNQDQPLDCVDFPGLAARLAQNVVQEKLTSQWIGHCLKQAKADIPKV